MSYAIQPAFLTPTLNVSMTGELLGKPAKVVYILGSRSKGWSSTSALGDACDYLDTSQALMTTPGIGQTLYLVSTSTSDDTGGTGARTVRIVYLDAAGDQQVTTVALDGTTPVSLGSGFSFIQWMEVASTGSGEVAVGDLSISSINGAATVATTFEFIRAGGNRSLSGRYQVPTGFTAYISHWGAASIGANMDVRLRALVFADDYTLSTEYHFQDRVYLSSGSNGEMLTNYISVPSGCVVKISAIPDQAAAGKQLDCDFHLIVVAN